MIPNITPEDAAAMVRLRAEAKRIGWSMKRMAKYAKHFHESQWDDDEVEQARKEIERSVPSLDKIR